MLKLNKQVFKDFYGNKNFGIFFIIYYFVFVELILDFPIIVFNFVTNWI